MQVKNVEECILCKSCSEACRREAINVKGDETRIIMQYETDGSMTAKEALKQALKILSRKYEELEKAL